MKKLMILGASQPQARLIEAAKELGYYTIAISIPGNYPGIELADRWINLDIRDKEKILEVAQKENIDGIATCCFDIPLESLGYVNTRMNLKGLSEHSSILSSDKLLMKEAFEKEGVNTAKYRLIRSKEDLEKAIEVLAFPVILKAVDLAGSRGIYKAETKEEARKLYDQVMEDTSKDYFIIEEFIEGKDFGAQAFVQNGKIIYVLPHGDYTYFDRTSMPIGHFAPIELGEEFNKKSIEECEKAIHAIGLDNCAVNIDLIEKNGVPYMIELTGRCGATCCAELVSIYYGINYYKMIAMAAVGDDASEIFKQRISEPVANASHFFMNFKEGIVESIESNVNPDDPAIYELTLDVQPGDPVHVYKSSKDKIGQVIVKGKNLEDCQKKLDEILDQVTFHVREN